MINAGLCRARGIVRRQLKRASASSYPRSHISSKTTSQFYSTPSFSANTPAKRMAPYRSAPAWTRAFQQLIYIQKGRYHSSRAVLEDETADEASETQPTISLSKVAMNLHADPRSASYVAEVFAYATLYDASKGEPIAEWLGFAMNENPHRINDWLMSLWHYLLTDSAKYHRKDAQPATDARIDEILTYVLYACRIAWAHEAAKDFVRGFSEAAGVKESFPKAFKLANAILRNDPSVAEEQPILGSFRPIDAIAGELSIDEHRDVVISQLTIGASTWLDCHWGRIFASANEDSIRKLIDVATLAPAENSWDEFVKVKSRYGTDTVAALKAVVGLNALWSLSANSRSYPVVQRIIETIDEEVKTAKDTYWSTENGCISTRADRLLVLERIISKSFHVSPNASEPFSSYSFMDDGPHDLSRSWLIDREVESITERLNELVEAASIPLKAGYSLELKTDEDIYALQKIQQRWEAHAVNYPPSFDNDEQKAECIADLQQAMHIIANESIKGSLFRLHGGAAYLGARIFEMGFNLDIPLSYDPKMKVPIAYYFYKYALDYTPSDPELVCDWGICLAQTRSPTAISVLQRAVELGSQSANWPLGLQFHIAGRTAEAVEALRKYGEIGPEQKKTADSFIGAIERGGVKAVSSEFGEALPPQDHDDKEK